MTGNRRSNHSHTLSATDLLRSPHDPSSSSRNRNPTASFSGQRPKPGSRLPKTPIVHMKQRVDQIRCHLGPRTATRLDSLHRWKWERVATFNTSKLFPRISYVRSSPECRFGFVFLLDVCEREWVWTSEIRRRQRRLRNRREAASAGHGRSIRPPKNSGRPPVRLLLTADVSGSREEAALCCRCRPPPRASSDVPVDRPPPSAVCGVE
ncbi:hypothetical protein BHE74_00014290 [Ensete ventricosum]|nr:hypothetical protein BHE74_00014290 [Ensete ventricosum]RZS14467.1 hypothetical protein BHM03_00046162 [Ensete ventricosum]